MRYHDSTLVLQYIVMYYGTTLVEARSTIVKHSSTMVLHSILWY